MFSLFRRGRVWWVRGSVNGRKLRCSLDTQFKEVAWRKAWELELSILEGTPRRQVLWPDFVLEFLAWAGPHLKPTSLRKYEFVLHRFGIFLTRHEPSTVQAVTPSWITDYMESRKLDRHPTRRSQVHHEGVKSDLRILRAAFNYAVRAGYIGSNPITLPRLNTLPGKTLPFSSEEIAKMLGAAADHANARPDLRAIILTFLGTGLRISDVCGLLKRDLNLDRARIVRRTEKRGKDVFLPLHAAVVDELRNHLARMKPLEASAPYVFPTQQGNRTWPSSLDAALRRLWKRCGIERAHAHRFRDTFAVRLLENGASLYDVAKLLGITVAVAERHYAPYVKELQERARRLVQALDFPEVSQESATTFALRSGDRP